MAIADETVNVAILAAKFERAHECLMRGNMLVQLDQHHAEIHVGTLEVREFFNRLPVLRHRLGVVVRLHVQVGQGEVQRRTRLGRDRLDQDDNRLLRVGLNLRD